MKTLLHSLSIRQQYFFIVSAVVIVLALLSKDVIRHIESSYLDNLMRIESKHTTELVAQSALEALITEDVPILQSIVKNIASKNKNILSIIIYSADNKELVKWEQIKNVKQIDSITWEKEVTLEKELFGKIIVHWRTDLHDHRIEKHVSYLSTLLLVIVIIIGLIFLLLTNNLIIKPIRIIDDNLYLINEYNSKSQQFESIKNISDYSATELFHLSNSVKQLMHLWQEKIKREEELTREVELRINAEKQLQQHRDTLQLQVDEKTKNLSAAMSLANAANQSKSEFLANMSHEIRTPLNGIIALGQLLERKVDNEEQLEIVEKLNLSGRLLQRVIDDILDLAKIEAGKFNLEYTDYNPARIVEECLVVSEYQAAEKGLQIISRINPAMPELLYGDANRLSQILLNLVSNAIKFTENGTVSIQLDFTNDAQAGIKLLLSVTDTGIGISEDEQQNIFSKFFQSDSSITRQYGGTGLGLSICQNLLNMMDGTISVNSRQGEGSTFSCQIPMQRAKIITKLEQINTDDVSFSDIHILIVDDEKINLFATKYLLETEGIQVSQAESGEEALAIAEQKVFDLVLMDLHMPGLNGWDTTRRFRDSLLPQLSHVPIIGLTADVLKETRDLCLAAGMNSVISKPFKFTSLLHQVELLTRERS